MGGSFYYALEVSGMQDWITITAVIALWSLGIAVVVAMVKGGRNAAAERKDMLDRLMSRDLVEYKTATEPMPIPSGPVSLSDEQEWAREVEMMADNSR